MNRLLFPLLFFVCYHLGAQSLAQKLAFSMQQMEADSQLQHAIIGFSVFDGKTGRSLYEHNSQIGLAPASTQKLFTSCAAFELLGHDYRYTTQIHYRYAKSNTAMGYLFIKCPGDPSFGSKRFVATTPDRILDSIMLHLRQNNIKAISLKYEMADQFNDDLPGGWIWEDIGNYYGAAAHGFNWMENQYDLILRSGNNMGDTAMIEDVQPPEAKELISGHLLSAKKGSGDNTIVYLPYGDDATTINGTIPVNEKAFPVSAALSYPFKLFSRQIENRLKMESIRIEGSYTTHPVAFSSMRASLMQSILLLKHLSPPFDSLNYWFLKKSINLYGEAFIKTMAVEKGSTGSTGTGVELLKDFWSQHGIDKAALHICDGSGLSPQNRVTTNALVRALQYAKTRPWFSSFVYALPEYNGMKMKSGSIGGARAFAGYQSAKDGNDYIFALIINNYDGQSLSVVKKMYRLLDNLK